MTFIKKFLGWSIAWIFYFVGDLVSIPMVLWDWSRLYKPYNWLMNSSEAIQSWGGSSGPWLFEEEES